MADPSHFVRKEFPLSDGSIWKPDRMERPFVLTDEMSAPQWLYVGTKQGDLSANVTVKITDKLK